LEECNNLILVFFGLIGSITWIKLISDLILDNVLLMSTLSNINSTFLACVIIAAGNTLPDLFNNGNLSSLGQGTIALISCFSGQLFNFLIGIFLNISGSKTRIQFHEGDHFLKFLIFSSICVILFNYALLIQNGWNYEKKQIKFLLIYYIIFIGLSILIIAYW